MRRSNGPAERARRLFRERLQQSAATSKGSHHYRLLLLMELAAGGSENANRTCTLLNSSLRAGDAVWIWDENRLAVLVDDLRGSSEAPIIAAKIYEILENPYTSHGTPGTVRAWSGACVFDSAGCDSDVCWRQARSALRSALAFRAGTCCFSGLLTGHTVMEHLDFTQDAYDAYRNNEFFIVYQPVFGMDGERITGIEALLRWQHPRYGLLYPQTFMESLEESGLIVPVGERLLSEACQVARTLSRKAHRSIRVCVNVSERQLCDPGFLIMVLDALYDAGMEADQLQLECSAQVLARDTETLGKRLLELANAGVRIAIDHFAVENTRVNALMNLPVTLIKMDQALIRGLAGNAGSRAIASAALATANGAGFNVAAVGIEDAGQVRALQEMGCIEVQGNILSRPQVAARLLSWLPA